MDSLLQFVAVAIVFCAIGLVVGLWVSKRRAKGLGNEPAAVVVSGKPVNASELPRTGMDIQRVPQIETDIESKIDKMSAEVEYLTQYLKIRKGLIDYGSRLHDAYDDFMRTIEDEFQVLERKEMEGREHMYRSSVLLFSLMMARVYVQAVGGQWKQDSLPELERYIERAKRLR
jgi:hypothetical protein